ncbi:hypothetical protein F4820DRAFT_467885 [Hypoxylon rubiginosum]|uniref:Uncharacterized protein n=1 Tax=Hypoxylon rubiginosum TaxID=110542 RepID=A0ACB9Z6R6_9PEZI|nr:hypothetical protein F4820DRAFT_467885 [Hypoxylon rubiginosum]
MDDSFLGRFFLGLNTEDFYEAKNAAVADQIARNFTVNPKLKYLGLAGVGRHGGALLFGDMDDDGKVLRKIVVKYSLNQAADDDLRNEANFLNMLSGAEHIAQIIPLAETDLNIAARGRRPTIALEYIPHGAIRQFRQRFCLYHADMLKQNIAVHIPNRILWRIMLCGARQIAAMAWPPKYIDPEARNVRESVRSPMPTMAITQNSSHMDNFILGDVLRNDPEHNMMPLVKLIDFGRGRIEESFEAAYLANLWGIAHLIVCLALPYQDERNLRSTDYSQHMLPFDCEVSGLIQTDAPLEFLAIQQFDPNLKHLIARCLAEDPSVPPLLPRLLAECEDAVANRGLQEFGENLGPYQAALETDQEIEALIRTIVLEADTMEPPADLGLDPLPTLARQVGTTLMGLACAVPRPQQQQQQQQQSRGGTRWDARASAGLPEGGATFAERVNQMAGGAAPSVLGRRRRAPQDPTLFERFVRRVNSMRRIDGSVRSRSVYSTDVD